jgi:hypothetical protein
LGAPGAPLSAVVFLVDPRSQRKLLIQRLAIAETSSKELRPGGYVGYRVGGLRQETPQMRVMPAEIVPSAVPVPTDSVAEPDHLRDEFLRGQRLKIVIS